MLVVIVLGEGQASADHSNFSAVVTGNMLDAVCCLHNLDHLNVTQVLPSDIRYTKSFCDY